MKDTPDLVYQNVQETQTWIRLNKVNLQGIGSFLHSHPVLVYSSNAVVAVAALGYHIG